MLSLGIPETFSRGVGRKILGLFMLAGLMPVIFTAGLAYFEIDRAAESRVFNTLQRNAKAYGVDVLTRLNVAAGKAVELSSAIESAGETDIASRSYLVEDFEAIWIALPNGSRQVLHGNPGNAAIAGLVEYDYLADAGTQMLVAMQGDMAELIMLRLIRMLDGAESLVAFRLRPEKVWGTAENIPYNTEFCVNLGSGHALFCTQEMDASIHRRLTLAVDGETSTWIKGDIEHIAASWQLFLAGAFRAPSFDIIASQPREYALRSNTDFRRVFLPAMGLVLVLVGLLSFSMIGQSLGPLKRLTRAAQRFAMGSFSTRVDVATDDEFGALASAFNDMATRLGEQIGILEAMSEIDHLILTGGSFQVVCNAVTGHLQQLTGCDTVAVIAREGSPESAPQFIMAHRARLFHDSIPFPDIDPQALTLARVEQLDANDPHMPAHVQKFVDYGQTHLALVPVVLNDDLKGVLLIGAPGEELLDAHTFKQCEDLAGRFAVALSSFERENALYRQANFDDLTGLPNRQLLKVRLRDLVEIAREKNQTGALLYLDLDRFKEINDVYGHSVGDIVLTQAAERIVSEIREEGLVARLGGDEFVVVFPNVASSDVVKAMASHLLSRLTEVFSVFGINHFVGASIGIVMFPDDGDSVEILLKNADAAMYRAKEAGRARYEFFNVQLNAESRRKIELERDLRVAFAANELEIYYQPQFYLDTGALSGAEVLLRWAHAEHGPVSATEFIPLAEESDLIVDIGRWVVEQTAHDLRKIIDKGLHPGQVSVNVSTRQLRDDRFVTDVLDSLAQHDIHPAQLSIEVTETAVAQNKDTAIGLLNRLRKHGVKVAIDDFGTGYSSLSYLQNMPFDVIKIDKSFVDLIGPGADSSNICRTIIKMAHELDKTSVAEGVETQEQLDFLRVSGCDVVQGFFYSEALPFDEFVAFIRKLDFHTQRRKALELI